VTRFLAAYSRSEKLACIVRVRSNPNTYIFPEPQLKYATYPLINQRFPKKIGASTQIAVM